MRYSKRVSKPILDSRGMMSADFLFALVLCVGLTTVLFALNFTLSMAEVAQYIAFSSARAHAAGHINQQAQEDLAKIKYNALTNHPVLRNLLGSNGNGWFQLSSFEVRGAGPSGNVFDDYPADQDRVPQVGVRFQFSSKLLAIKIPFLGSTSEDDQGAGFSTKVTGLLIREPTQEECWNLQVKRRYDAIINLDPRFGTLGNSGKSKYIPMEDNGC